MVEFFGFSHHPLNLDITPYLGQQFSEHLNNWGANTTLFFESAQGTPEDAEYERDVFRRYGYRARLVAQITDQGDGFRPIGDGRIVNERIAEIEAALDRGQWRIDLLPAEDLQTYLMYRDWDRLQAQYHFSFEREAHSPEVIKKIKALKLDNDRLVKLFEEAWKEGRYDDFKRLADSHYKLAAARDRYRNDEISEALKKKVNKLLASPEGGSIFVLMGRDHVTVLHPSRKKLKKGDVEFKESGGSYESINRLNPSQRYLALRVMDALGQEYIRQERILELGYKYTVTQHRIEDLIAGVSDVEIRKLCESKTNLLEFIRQRGLNI